ncbi:hypothetical protein BB561_001911 [Smittium simulii]|uniref:peptidylprolyl isomerase n=1 Tax=Smittium simulii TaxID=133385 RepID=A0A2T9YSF2_9FUNG|nr:hypothetical protein BB561_001911 [Smittium simulii]
MNPRVFLDFEIDNVPAGRVIFELFKAAAPITCENFRALCTGEYLDSEPSCVLHYKNVSLHRIVKGFMIQGGVLKGKSGPTNWSIHGENFNDENLDCKIDQKYLLCMANKGPNTNASQFFITTRQDCLHLDQTHFAFGKVIAGFDVIDRIENIPVKPPKNRKLVGSKPLSTILISHCGELLALKKKQPASAPLEKIKDHSGHLSTSSDTESSDSSRDSYLDKKKKHKKNRSSKKQRHSNHTSSDTESSDSSQDSYLDKKKKHKKNRSSKKYQSQSDTEISDSSSSSSSLGTRKYKSANHHKKKSNSAIDTAKASIFTPRSRWEDDRFIQSDKYSSRRDRLVVIIKLL